MDQNFIYPDNRKTINMDIHLITTNVLDNDERTYFAANKQVYLIKKFMNMIFIKLIKVIKLN